MKYMANKYNVRTSFSLFNDFISANYIQTPRHATCAKMKKQIKIRLKK